MSIYNYSRRRATAVKVGDVTIGGDAPIAIQSMTNTNTNDTAACVEQINAIAEAGADIVRLTTQGVREAANMAEIKQRLDRNIPLVADVHFNPKAAFEAATHVEKVRINPGNFVDAARTFKKLEFSDDEYKEEIDRIRQTLVPFLELCRSNRTAVRLGVNHGSLSDRIMSQYGDSPAGMVESVMEFLRIAREIDFNDIVISVKASNVTVMVETVLRLVDAMDAEDMHFPLHLGVTEAGDAEDGRIKSAAGIGALLALGLGDTIRVSLSEPPENEIPVAIMLRDYIVERDGHAWIDEPETVLPGEARSHTALYDGKLPAGTQFVAWHADKPAVTSNLLEITAAGPNPVGAMAAAIDNYISAGGRQPVLMRLAYNTRSIDELRIKAAADFGTLLLNGYGTGIRVDDSNYDGETLATLELDILQAVRARTSKTEYISCPSCGRTLFDLQNTLKQVKAATSHLKGLKIGVMGCIVNGPGEMADADYGYVGAGPDRVSIYRGKECIIKNIPASEALPKLLELIESDRKTGL